MLAFVPEQLTVQGPTGATLVSSPRGYIRGLEGGKPLPPFEALGCAGTKGADRGPPAVERGRALTSTAIALTVSTTGGAVPLRLILRLARKMSAIGVRPNARRFRLPDACIIKPAILGKHCITAGQVGRDRMPIGAEGGRSGFENSSRLDHRHDRAGSVRPELSGAGKPWPPQVRHGRRRKLASGAETCRARSLLGARGQAPAARSRPFEATAPGEKEKEARSNPGPSHLPLKAIPAEARSVLVQLNCGICINGNQGSRSGRTFRHGKCVA